MHKLLVTVFMIFVSFGLIGQDYTSEVTAFQKDLNDTFKNPEKSPLKKDDLKTFQGLSFFPINETYRVTAKFTRTEKATPFQMKTTTDRLPVYEVYGVATFTIDSTSYSLNIYQNHSLKRLKAYKDNLFLPFTDLTNGTETYGGGRYIQLKIPENDTIVIDFNKAYHPYCLYNYIYSCPIVPEENHLELEITAGVKL